MGSPSQHPRPLDAIPAPDEPGIARALGSALLFLLGLGAGCLLIGALLPFPEVPELTHKLAWLRAHRDDYTTVFIGSSRTRRQISPAVFDETMQSRGVASRSYNLGLDAMTFPELGYVVDRFLETQPRRLRTVVIDLNPLRRKIYPPREEQSSRGVHWHDLRHTADVCEAILRDMRAGHPEHTRGELLDMLGWHLQMMLQRYTNLGRGAEFIARPPQRGGKLRPVGVGGAGFAPVHQTLRDSARARFEEKLAAMKASGPRVSMPDPVLARQIRRLVGKVESHGARVIFIIAPTVDLVRPALPPPHEIPGVSLLPYDEPDRFPILYQPTHRYDLQHLNAEGAQEFSRLLANDIADLQRRE